MKKSIRKPFQNNNARKETFRRPIFGGYLIFFLTFPLVFLIIKYLSQGNVFLAVVTTLCLVLYYFGGSNVRKGMQNEHQNKLRKWQRSASFPWKITGCISIAAATALASLFLADKTIFAAIGFGLVSLFGAILVYGVDARYSQPNAVSPVGITTDEIIEALEEAEAKLQVIETASFKIRDLNVKNQLHRITSKAHDILNTIEKDPKDLRKARKFLNTYLDGTKKVIEGYVDVQEKNIRNAKLDHSFVEVLNTVETVFNEQHHKLFENDVLDLDIQIEVLQTQMKHEGVI